MFLAPPKHFRTVADFAVWLHTQPRPTWGMVGSTYHNSYIPDESQWRGFASMASMQKSYEAKGWDRGPHVFLAFGTPNPANDGIWVMSPLTEPGIHAADCNAKRFGLENVGNFQHRPMNEAQLDLLVGTTAALHRWANLPPDINAHRDCMPGRTCPGNAAYMQKGEIQRRLAVALNPSRYTSDSPILNTPGPAITNFPAAPRGGYDSVSIISILRAYTRVCIPVGVDPVLAVAQMCHETGALTSWWSQRPRRNPAGIGVTGATRTGPQPYPRTHWHWDGTVWRFGIAFNRWEPDAIEAHVGRLLAYAVKQGEETQQQQALIITALSVRNLPDRLRGVAPTLQGLEGTWAVPGDFYADGIAKWANRLIE